MQVLIRVGTRCDRSIVDDYEFAVVPLLCILKGGRGGRGDIDELIMSARFSQRVLRVMVVKTKWQMDSSSLGAEGTAA